MIELKCNICGKSVDPEAEDSTIGVKVAFCCDRHLRRFIKRVIKEDRIKQFGW